MLAFGVLRTGASAGNLTLAGKERWLAIASTQDPDTAIGIAGLYASERAKVASTQSGWFAVILGPYGEASVQAVLKAHPGVGEIPADSFLSRGEKYLETVWEEKPLEEARVLVAYEAGKPAQFSVGELTIGVSMGGDAAKPGPTHAVGTVEGQTVFSFSTPDEYSSFGAEAGLLKLDPKTEAPQVVFTRFTGGAHCCTQTWIASQAKGAVGWTLVDTGVLDGGGFSYEDSDGDGAHELMQVDNDFLYAFDSYAGSIAPIRIKQLRGNALVDVSDMAAFRPLLKRDLARMEFMAKLDADLWHANGFLAGWVAAKMRLGGGADAWLTALENLDKESDFGPQICKKKGKPIAECDFDDLERVPIAKALAAFFNERDYGELPPAAQAHLR